MNKICIIIPVYNAERYLIECVKSVQSQKLNNLEIICENNIPHIKKIALLSFIYLLLYNNIN